MANAVPQTTMEPATLAEAAALEAAGRQFEAIGLLTEANRSGRDPRIEERLVELRHRAAETLDRHPLPDQVPLPTVEPPDGTLPELSPDELDVASLRRGLAQHGCVLVRQLIPTERALELAGGIDTALEAFDAGAEGAPVADTSPWYVPFKPASGKYRVGGRRNWVRASGGVWSADSPRMLFELLEMVEETGVGELITEHLGERPALSANKCTLRRVPVDSNTNWHQDGAFLGAEVRTVNLWLSLSHCGRDAPGLDIIPQRIDHVVETGTEGAIFDWSVSPQVVSSFEETTPALRPEFAPGDAMLFDQFFLHRTAVTPEMTRERHAIETWFFAPSAYPEGQIPLVY